MPRFNHDRLKRAREMVSTGGQFRGITVESLAVALGVSASTVRNWEAGRTEPSASQLGRIARLLSKDPSYFLRGAA